MNFSKNKVMAYKVRIYPNKEAEKFILGQLETCRICYNEMLNKYLEERNEFIKDHDNKEKPKLNFKYGWVKNKFPWMNQYLSSPLDFTVRKLQESVLSWYKNYHKDNPNFHKPTFKKKDGFSQDSFTVKKTQFKIEDNNLVMSKIKIPIKIINHRNLSISNATSVTIKKLPSNKYYAIFNLYIEEFPLFEVESNSKTIAIDLGIRKYFTYIDSDGNSGIIENPKHYKKYMERIKFLDKSLERKRKEHNKNNNLNHNDKHMENKHPYSNRYKKVKIQRAKYYEHIANTRKYFLDNLTTRLVKKYNKIIIEDVRIDELIQQTNETFKNVSRTARKNINSAQYDVGWYIFRSMLEYKCELYDRTLIIADEFYTSTQTCSNCGYINEELKDVNIREWICPNCNTKHDRDLNACKNLLNKYN